MNKKDYYKENKDILSNKAKEYYKKRCTVKEIKRILPKNREVIRERARNKCKSLT